MSVSGGRLRSLSLWLRRSGNGPGVVGQLHHAIEAAFGVVASNVINVDQSLGIMGYWFILLQAVELPLIGAIILEAGLPHDLHRPVGAKGIPREPDFAVGATADAAQ